MRGRAETQSYKGSHLEENPPSLLSSSSSFSLWFPETKGTKGCPRSESINDKSINNQASAAALVILLSLLLFLFLLSSRHWENGLCYRAEKTHTHKQTGCAAETESPRSAACVHKTHFDDCTVVCVCAWRMCIVRYTPETLKKT